MELVRPSVEYLSSYVDGLKKIVPGEEPFFTYFLPDLVKIAEDPDRYLSLQEDPGGIGDPVELPDGTMVPRLPSITRWMWDGEISGRIQLRWSPGSTDLPSYCLGHVGYAVFPWKRRLGYANKALKEILPFAQDLEMEFVEIVTDVGNEISQKVVAKSGGVFHERFTKPATSEGGEAFRYRIYLNK